MQKEYYKPNLSEFKQGFRYEHYIPIQEAWAKERFYLNDSHINIVKYVDIQTEDTLLKVRVKSLDHDDIKEAGWVEVRKSLIAVGIYFEKGKFELYFQNGGIIILEGNVEVRFRGKIANYNKLLDVMEMLGIKKD